MLQLKHSFEVLVDTTLDLETVENEKDSDGEGGVQSNPKKKKFPFRKPKFFPSKKKKQVGSSTQSQATPQAKPFACYNCGSPNHPVRECPKPKRCNHCKAEGHLVAACPKKNRGSRSGNLSVATSSDAT